MAMAMRLLQQLKLSYTSGWIVYRFCLWDYNVYLRSLLSLSLLIISVQADCRMSEKYALFIWLLNYALVSFFLEQINESDTATEGSLRLLLAFVREQT